MPSRFGVQCVLRTPGIHWIAPCADLVRHFMGTQTHETEELSESRLASAVAAVTTVVITVASARVVVLVAAVPCRLQR